MGDKNRNTPIIKVIIFVFIAVMVISISSVQYLIFTSWSSSAKQTTESIALEMNENINTRINSYLYVPEQINESSYKIINNEILDLSEKHLRD